MGTKIVLNCLFYALDQMYLLYDNFCDVHWMMPYKSQKGSFGQEIRFKGLP